MTAARIPALSDYQGHSATSPAPRLSVVTVVRNGARTLPRTIASVRAQALPGLEYIIVDGGSRDGTLEIIRANEDIVTFWKSEPDGGISDGFNKGIALAQGEYVLLLNADDWLSQGQLAFGLESLDRTGADFVFGDLVYHDAGGRPLHVIKGDPFYAARIGHVMPALNHPTVMVRRDAYERFGLFDLSLRYAMDYELLLRFCRCGGKGVYDGRMRGHMTLAGQSDLHSIAALAEVRDVSVRHGSPALTAASRFLFRVSKMSVRRLLERIMPRFLVQSLRRRVNRDMMDYTA